MQSELTNNPETKSPVKTCVKTRSMYRMSQQSACNEKTQHPSLAKNDHKEEQATHDFSQESIAAVLCIEAVPQTNVE